MKFQVIHNTGGCAGSDILGTIEAKNKDEAYEIMERDYMTGEAYNDDNLSLRQIRPKNNGNLERISLEKPKLVIEFVVHWTLQFSSRDKLGEAISNYSKSFSEYSDALNLVGDLKIVPNITKIRLVEQRKELLEFYADPNKYELEQLAEEYRKKAGL